MSVSYETDKGTCIFHGSASPLYHRLPPSWVFALVCLCGEGAALDTFVFASESERWWWLCRGMGEGWNWSQALHVFTSVHTRWTEHWVSVQHKTKRREWEPETGPQNWCSRTKQAECRWASDQLWSGHFTLCTAGILKMTDYSFTLENFKEGVSKMFSMCLVELHVHQTKLAACMSTSTEVTHGLQQLGN